MRPIFRFSVVVAILLVMSVSVSALANALQPGDAFPSLTLPAPDSKTHATYLGISDGVKSFDVTTLKAPFVLVEVFNSYCVHCQHDAPLMKQLTSMVRDRGLDGKLKIVCIAANNNAFEVGLFRDKYELDLPMLADPDMEAANKLGVTGTPTYFLVGLKGKPKVLHKSVGRIPDIDEFFAVLRKKAGI